MRLTVKGEDVAHEEDEDDDHQHDGQLPLLLLGVRQGHIATVRAPGIQIRREKLL